MTSEEEYTLAGQVASWFDSSSVPHWVVTLVYVAEALDAAVRGTPTFGMPKIITSQPRIRRFSGLAEHP
jgi:hypothetical protein